MRNATRPPLLCPVCGGLLSEDERALVCGAGHSYDIAAAGYCNLLRPGKMRNRSAGDDREMVAARTRFLSAGYYEPILERMNGIIRGLDIADGVLIDAGCGEGYYTNGIAKENGGLHVLGIDASKHAVSAAARGAKRMGISDRVRLIAASSAAMPVPDGCAELVLSVFSPCFYGEFARVTRAGGHLLAVSAGRDHLYELKEALYGVGSVRPNVPIAHAALAGPHGYDFVCGETLTYKTTVSGKEEVGALFSMTPYKWKTSVEGADAVSALDALTVTVSMDFSLLVKK